MNVGLHHRGVHAHAAAGHDAMALCQGDDPGMNLFNHLRSQSLSQPPQSLGVGHLRGADVGELAVHQIAPHLPFQVGKTPIPDMLEQQHPQHDLGGCTPSPPRAAVRATLL